MKGLEEPHLHRLGAVAAALGGGFRPGQVLVQRVVLRRERKLPGRKRHLLGRMIAVGSKAKPHVQPIFVAQGE